MLEMQNKQNEEGGGEETIEEIEVKRNVPPLEPFTAMSGLTETNHTLKHRPVWLDENVEV